MPRQTEIDERRADDTAAASPQSSHFDVDLATARQRRSLKWRKYPDDVIPLWVAEMDYALAPPIVERLQDLLLRSDFGYPPEPLAMSTEDFSEAVSGWMQRRHGWEIDPALVSIAPDTTSVLEMAIDRFTTTGDPVVLNDPAYPPFQEVIENASRVPLWVPMTLHDGRWHIDLERLEAAFAGADVRLYLHCNPHNPTGTVFTLDEATAIADLAERHDVIVVSDEVHADISYGTTHAPFATVSPTAADRTVTASAASKAFNFAGLRCGYAISGNRRLHDEIETVPARVRKLVSLPGYEATIAAYTGGDEWLAAATKHLGRMRDRAIARLAAIHSSLATSVPQGTYLLWTDWRALDLGGDPHTFLLEQAKVALSPGPAFGPSGAGFLRLNYATSQSILDESLDRIAAAVGSR